MSAKKLVIHEFKYLQNKKRQKQAVKSTRIRRSYRTFWLFSFHSDMITEKKLAIYLQKLAIFNIYHVFAPFMKLRGSRVLNFFSLYDIRNKAVFLFLEYSSQGKPSVRIASLIEIYSPYQDIPLNLGYIYPNQSITFS